MADTPGTAAAAAAVFGKVARKGKRKGSKRRRVADEEEEVVSAATLQDIRDEQRARVRRRGVEGSGHAAAKAAAAAAAAVDTSAGEGKETEDKDLPGVSAAALAHVEERAAKMGTLLAGGFQVEAATTMDLDAEDNPIMLAYVQQRLAEMRGDEGEDGASPGKPGAQQDAMYALPEGAAAALAAARAAKPGATTHAGPLYMNMGLAEVALPQKYMDANLQATKQAIAVQLSGGARDPLAAPAGGVGSFTSNFAAQAVQYEAASSKHTKVPGMGDK